MKNAEIIKKTINYDLINYRTAILFYLLNAPKNELINSEIIINYLLDNNNIFYLPSSIRPLVRNELKYYRNNGFIQEHETKMISGGRSFKYYRINTSYLITLKKLIKSI